ncbi:zinc ribbon domain-containing protein [Geodermatophilus sp. YIM 151500]|uniref:zinc ribbon domain-containing protein n=1 Tax=Geodermatophilus sp. YIM 151500 TaxID=2984531 RepID=UPI0021E37172|nr:zinc ribbon domain-containing protein [Geodermatophilus sp. YIM 151500]MCV2492023.1 zinc ribbon domain-containing protein [Geodermatophilus sp. YIM 151500]
MSGHSRRIPFVVALTTAVLVVGAGPAAAHEHPTPIERAAPGVVFVEARAEVEVSLVEHLQSDPEGIHIRIIQSTSRPVLASASGFVVDPTGAIVTTGAITEADLEEAAVYAVNQAFKSRYGDAAPLDSGSSARQRIGAPEDRLQQRLEACYPPHTTNDAGGCVVRVTPTYVVYPFVTSQEEFGQLEAELLPASTPDVAVLRVRGANGMPTVALGESTEGSRALGALGFTGIPGNQQSLQAINTHLDVPGGSVLQTADLTEEETADAARLAEGLTAGMHGGPLVAENGQVVGFLKPEADSGPPPATAGRVVDAVAIREVLDAEGITPRRGPADSNFEAAMHAFKNGGFAASIPALQQTLALFPGHTMASENLAVAEQNVADGNPGEAPAPLGNATADSGGSGFPWAVVLIVVAVALVLAVAAALVLRRRRSAAGPDSAADGLPPRPGPGGPPEGRPAAPVPAAAGRRERQPVPSGAPSAASGAVSVLEGSGSGRGVAGSPRRAEPAAATSAPSRSGPGQRAAAAVADSSHRASRATAAPSSPRRDTTYASVAEGRNAFCTSCGARLRPDDRFCGRCGGATG